MTVLFYRKNGSFVVSKVPSGSYIVEIVNPNYIYEPIRVEINSKGKYRARKVNYIQSSHVHQIPYPLEFVNYMPAKYFYTREQWKVTDFLFNSMVISRHFSFHANFNNNYMYLYFCT